jgi:hypothetical protein
MHQNGVEHDPYGGSAACRIRRAGGVADWAAGHGFPLHLFATITGDADVEHAIATLVLAFEPIR